MEVVHLDELVGEQVVVDIGFGVRVTGQLTRITDTGAALVCTRTGGWLYVYVKPGLHVERRYSAPDHTSTHD